ncbi:hypothetical protein ACHAAC_06675 [Aeromicrobium sp. CF4.19]|uniref:hypothetical protein n=1 Tax=Aeromicrobium sp. CF4.19 TaxID=3373082 RepID=UPI003EE589A2
MSNYIDPHLPGDELIRRDSRLSRRQSRKDFLSAQAEGGFDAAIADSKRREKAVLRDGFKRIPGASRSGALTPQTKSRLERQEREGLVELQRDVCGEIAGYRETQR